MLRVLVNLTNEYSQGCEHNIAHEHIAPHIQSSRCEAFGRLGGLSIAAECLILFGTEQVLRFVCDLSVSAAVIISYH